MTSSNTTQLRKAVDRRILKLLETMWSHEDAALAFTGPEGVHQMRITSRKVRSALDATRDILDGKRVRNVRKGVRKLSRALGGVRDGDVLMAELDDLRGGDDEENRPCIARLKDRLTRERDAAREHLVTVLDDLAASRFPEASIAVFNDSASRKKPKIRPQDARRMVNDPVLDFVDQIRTIPAEDEVEALHEIRITTKRLRYTLQFLEKPLAPESTAIIPKLAALQDQLGEIHNQDVLIDLVISELHSIVDEAADLAMRADSQPSEGDRASWQDLLCLHSAISERRRTWYASFLEQRRELESEGFTDDLLALTRPRRH
jgi:CHAD domain-containing protein